MKKSSNRSLSYRICRISQKIPAIGNKKKHTHTTKTHVVLVRYKNDVCCQSVCVCVCVCVRVFACVCVCYFCSPSAPEEGLTVTEASPPGHVEGWSVRHVHMIFKVIKALRKFSPFLPFRTTSYRYELFRVAKKNT